MSRTLAPDPMRQAFASRLHEVVDHLVQTVDPSTMEEVLAMADALSGLSVATHPWPPSWPAGWTVTKWA